MVGLKTHSKVIFVVRRDYSGLKRYVHIGTGNYHAGTARAYCDLGLLTCDPEIGDDMTEFFNFLTLGYAPARRYKKLLPSPRILKKALLDGIKGEIEHQAKGHTGLIQLKTNALTDQDLIAALYQASQAGVHVDLIVRDSCLLRPGITGLSDNIRVVSVVGAFLEHSRAYAFRRGTNGQEQYYIGSADLMKSATSTGGWRWSRRWRHPPAGPAARDPRPAAWRAHADIAGDGNFTSSAGPAGTNKRSPPRNCSSNAARNDWPKPGGSTEAVPQEDRQAEEQVGAGGATALFTAGGVAGGGVPVRLSAHPHLPGFLSARRIAAPSFCCPSHIFCCTQARRYHAHRPSGVRSA